MAWKRDSDTIAFDPRVLEVLEHALADDRSVNEVWGFFSRMAAQSAQHTTDYVVPFAVALVLAGNSRDNLERLWEQCEFAGLGEVIELPNGRRAFQMVNDPEFVHIKSAEEIAFEQQRKADNSDTHMTTRIRLRDGDACRYCGLVVWFGQRRGDKRGTYDHRPPGQPGSAETSVVACGACNSGRGGLSKGLSAEDGLARADELYPLRPPPDRPYWSPSTRGWLQRYTQLLSQYGLTPPPLAPEDEEPLEAGTPTPGAAAAPTGARPATGDAADPSEAPSAAATDPGEAPAAAAPGRSGRNQQNGSLQDPELPGRDGSGRVGTGRAPKSPPTSRARRRGRRGGRPRQTPRKEP